LETLSRHPFSGQQSAATVGGADEIPGFERKSAEPILVVHKSLFRGDTCSINASFKKS
jgi:hypothetical protein